MTDIFMTCSDIIGKDVSDDAAEDSFSFLQTLLNSQKASQRQTLVNHSRDGEFAYRKGPWKLVYHLNGNKIVDSRGMKLAVSLYNLDDDISELNDLSDKLPDKVNELALELETVIINGRSTVGPRLSNDCEVDVKYVQAKRWM